MFQQQRSCTEYPADRAYDGDSGQTLRLRPCARKKEQSKASVGYVRNTRLLLRGISLGMYVLNPQSCHGLRTSIRFVLPYQGWPRAQSPPGALHPADNVQHLSLSRIVVNQYCHRLYFWTERLKGKDNSMVP